MGSRALQGNDSDFRVLDVNQQPVGVDMTLPTAFILAMKLVISAFFRERFILFQKVGDGKKIIQQKTSFLGQF